MVEVLVQRVEGTAPVPSYSHPGDAGADVTTTVDVHLRPGERALVPTGIAIALPSGYAAFVHPRSGLAARLGVSIVNAPGTVDAGYRGEIKVLLVNLDPTAGCGCVRGDRIAQLVVQRVEVAGSSRWRGCRVRLAEPAATDPPAGSPTHHPIRSRWRIWRETRRVSRPKPPRQRRARRRQGAAMIFRRRRPDEGDPDKSDQGFDDDPVGEAAAQRPRGPWDRAETGADDGDESYVDLGGLVIRGHEGLELQMQVDAASQQIAAVVLAGADSGLELRAFAAPKSGGIWAEVRRGIAAEAARHGGTATEQDGEFGIELLLVVPAAGPDGPTAVQRSRVVGVEGPRWLLRGTFLGLTAATARPGRSRRDRVPGRHRGTRDRADGPREDPATAARRRRAARPGGVAPSHSRQPRPEHLGAECGYA